MKNRVVLLLGASGLVGSKVLEELLLREDVAEIRVLVRKPLNLTHAKVKERITDFSSLEPLDDFFQVDALYCCIGTTRKKTPDLVAYKAIDFGIPLSVGEQVKAKGCREIHVVSSVGANAQSRNYYLKIKGEMEEGIERLGFACCRIYRPSMLLGIRKESRPLERLGQKLMPLFDLFTFGGKYHSIDALDVARAMCRSSEAAGTKVLEYREMMLK